MVGDPVDRVPHLLTFSALYVDGETLTLELDRAGFAVASGSACSASSEHPSHVLAAMGALTHGNVRLGLSADTTESDVDAFARRPAAHRRPRSAAGSGVAVTVAGATGAAQPSAVRSVLTLDCLGMRCPRPIIETGSPRRRRRGRGR